MSAVCASPWAAITTRTPPSGDCPCLHLLWTHVSLLSNAVLANCLQCKIACGSSMRRPLGTNQYTHFPISTELIL